jgi:hypothetical protein
LFIALAEADLETALASLTAIADTPTRFGVALALLDDVADDDALVERMAATLPTAAGSALRVEALTSSAARDPSGAFERAMRLDEPLRTAAVLRVVPVWAERHPQAALAMADRLDTEAARAYTSAAFAAWGRVDPEGLVRYLETAELDQSVFNAIISFREVIRANPTAADAIRKRLPSWAAQGFDR